MAYSYLDFAEDVLRNAPRPLLPIEIWELGKNSEHFGKLKISGKTPQNSLADRIYVDVRDNTEKTKLVNTNVDFKKFIKDITYDYEKREIHPKEYDQIPEDIGLNIEGILKNNPTTGST